MNREQSNNIQCSIGIFGHYGHENLGDEAIVQACLQHYQTNFPNLRLVLFSSMPADSTRRYGLPARPIRQSSGSNLTSSEHLKLDQSRAIDHKGNSANENGPDSFLRRTAKRIPFLVSVVKFFRAVPAVFSTIVKEVAFLRNARRELNDIDILTVTGSNQFLDNFGGLWGYPYTLLKWRVLAILAGIPVVFMSVGAGPLNHLGSRTMIRRAIRGAAFVSFRDEASRDLVDPDNKLSGHVYPDLAFAIEKPKDCSKSRFPAEPPVIAINPMAVFDARYWYDPNPQRYENYVRRVASIVATLFDRGHMPQLFATQCKDINVVKDVIKTLEHAGHRVTQHGHCLYYPLTTVDELLNFICTADIVVPTRFHGTVLSLWAGKPTVGLCYYRKSSDLLGEFGQARFSFDIDDFTTEDVTNAVDEILVNYNSISTQIQDRAAEQAGKLAGQFTQLSDLLIHTTRKQQSRNASDNRYSPNVLK